MNEDDIIKDDDPHEAPPPEDLELEAEGAKKKDLIDEETESLDDLEEEELGPDKEDLMDDVEEM